MLTFPNLSSEMLESPMKELLELNPVHFVSLPTVPLPRTGRFGPVAIGVMLKNGALALTSMLEGMRLKLKLKRGRRCDWASSVES